MTDPKAEIIEYLTKKIALHREHLKIASMSNDSGAMAHYSTIISCLEDIIKRIETH